MTRLEREADGQPAHQGWRAERLLARVCRLTGHALSRRSSSGLAASDGHAKAASAVAASATCARVFGRLSGRAAEGFGLSPAVVLGQDLADRPGPVRDGAMADLAAVTGRCVMVTGKLQEIDLIITSHDASPIKVSLPVDRGAARDSRHVRTSGCTARLGSLRFTAVPARMTAVVAVLEALILIPRTGQALRLPLGTSAVDLDVQSRH